MSQSDTHHHGLLKSSAIVSIMTMLSRILGLLRDVVIAKVVGAGMAADTFFVAFKIPNFLRRLFSEGAFSQAFVPVLSAYKQQHTMAEVRALLDRVAGVLGGSLIIVTTLAVLGAPVVAALFAPGWLLEAPDKFHTTAQMIRLTFPYLLLISITGFAGAILNSYGRFAIPAFTPVLLNITLICAALFAVPLFDDGAFALAWGVLLAGIIQLAFQWPFLHALRLTPRPVWDWQHEGVKRILTLMGPALFGVSVSQINLLLDTVLASFLPTGSVSWLYYSDRLIELPLGVFAIAISTVILPSLSRHQANTKVERFTTTLDWGLRTVLLIAIPAAAALMLLADPILATLFQYGAFHPKDVAMATLSLRAYAIGLVAFMLIKILAPAFYARHDTRTPVAMGIKAMVANMIFNIVFVIPLAYYWQIGHVGLAFATSIAAYLNAYWLYRTLRQRRVYQPSKILLTTLIKVVIATLLMVLILGWLVPPLSEWLAWTWQPRVMTLLKLCLVGIIVYGASLLLLGTRLRDFRGH